MDDVSLGWRGEDKDRVIMLTTMLHYRRDDSTPPGLGISPLRGAEKINDKVTDKEHEKKKGGGHL
jgi:hypothetical protein